MRTRIHNMTTQAEVRTAFWGYMFNLKHKPKELRGKTQNEMPADVRMAFVDFVDTLERDGEIPEALAQRVTL